MEFFLTQGDYRSPFACKRLSYYPTGDNSNKYCIHTTSITDSKQTTDVSTQCNARAFPET